MRRRASTRVHVVPSGAAARPFSTGKRKRKRQ